MIWGDREALAQLILALGEDPEIGQVLIFFDQAQGLTGAAELSWRATREGIMAGAALSPVPTLVSSTLPELLDDDAAVQFAAAGVAPAAGLRTGLVCVAAGFRDGVDPARLRGIAATANALAEGGRAPGRWLAEHEAKQMLRAHGVAVPQGRVVSGEREAVAALGELGGNVALKLSAAGVQHKSELGAVALGLQSADEMRRSYTRLAALAVQHDGCVLAEAMAAPGVELIIAARTDGIVPALVLGLGGIWTELLDDVTIVPLPADAERVQRALRSLRGAPLLLGARGGQSVDLDAAARLAEAIGELLVQRSLAEVECNPVLVGHSGAGAVAVDAAIRLRAQVR
jgi:acyl-CoA synthetase (NDP forming)